ncbi:MAG: M61 family metallopeptidase [Pseudomonadota bacterium]|uniref:M61 family metallopeptidase n=2 Tax=Sphingomonadaceae TaxID=41297 RepID=UPI00076A5CB6|tara:strand:+ start:47152 stop:49125 length:1974 start_codon:yes stop_codon:yes gene_type:complete
MFMVQQTRTCQRVSKLRQLIASTAIVLALLASPAIAQNSKPQPVAVKDIVPAARDIPFPGVMTLEVDATDVDRAIFSMKQTVPVPEDARNNGRLTLLYPQWLPGNHAPRGEIEKLVGLKFSASGKPLAWRRDSLDVYAFHVTLPKGVREVVAEFQFVSPTASNQGRVVVAPKMMNLRWNNVSLYPAGYFTRNIPVDASVTWPAGWQAGSAMRAKRTTGSKVAYERVDYDTLVDSPMFAGAHFKSFALSDKVTLNVVADAPEYLAATPDQIEAHKRLVAEAEHLFGVRHYDRYDFLLSLSDEMSGIGIEHHRSSENGVGTGYFTDWAKGPGSRNLLPHEMTHSWNGKHRRPQGIWAPDFRTPSRDDLLWVYEGQTQFWGYVLGARSGLFSYQDTLDAFASIAAGLDRRAGRNWRPLVDTTHDPIIAARRPKGWTSYQRSEDYYNEGMMIWLEADQIIRRESGNARSLQDFARSFFGGREGDWGVVTYELPDVVAALNAVQPYDWQGFFQSRVFEVTPEVGKQGFALGGYELVYVPEASNFIRSGEAASGTTDLSHSIGLIVEKDGKIAQVMWGSPAFDAGMTVGDQITGVAGRDYSGEALKSAVAATTSTGSVQLLVKRGKRYRETALSYRGGLRYPALRKTGQGETGLDRLLAPQTR